MPTESKAISFLTFFFGTLIGLAIFLPAFPQDPGYHNFALDRPVFGIPHFRNVVSNVAFIVVALKAFRRGRGAHRRAEERVFIAGVFLTGFGSAYYHWAPASETLFWDRLPMSIAFSGVIASLVAARVHERIGQKLLWPVAVMSAATVIYWRWTETQGRGNLTPYGVLQFGTVLLVLAILLIFPRKDATQRCLWYAVGFYGGAKLLEAFDSRVSQLLVVLGGHPLKHVAAAIGCWFVWRGIFDPSLGAAHPSARSETTSANCATARPN